MKRKLDEQGLLYLLSKLLLLFVRQEAGKGLSQNDLTDELKAAILSQFSGSWHDLADRPTAVSAWLNDLGFQTAAQVEAAIDAAIAQLGEVFTVVDELPAQGSPGKIYLVSEGGNFAQFIWHASEWRRKGAADISLEGYFNEHNLVPITNAEIDAMLASLV
jgi:hypothetical protein